MLTTCLTFVTNDRSCLHSGIDMMPELSLSQALAYEGLFYHGIIISGYRSLLILICIFLYLRTHLRKKLKLKLKLKQ